MVSSSSDIELIEAQGRIWGYAYTYIINKCLKCAIQLGIPDVIHRHSPGPTSLPALLAALQLHPSKHDAVRRLLRLLVHAGFFKLEQEEKECNYSLTPASELLLLFPDKQPPAHLFLGLDSGDDAFGVWSSLSTWFRRSDGAAAAEAILGMSFWDAMARERWAMPQFYDAMTGDFKLVARVMVSDYCRDVFRGVGSLVDVGGGTGIMSAAIAGAYPNISCTVFDLPEVVPDSREARAIGLPNLEFVGGTMFEKIPHGDAILLKWVLHNWDDENCVKILKNCREAVSSSDKNNRGKVILIDMVVEINQIVANDKDFSQVQLCSDLLMMCLVNGKERTEAEFNNLFITAGFSGYKIVRALGPRSIIEVYP
ncbi:unnamed protein product [Linum tenue]|uniref:Uncharacterized protein n=3 Tax=Linum tenue TaxID=586396 RepID=A0AAV0LBY3_9ROSI|nr:unnamed protein product [Linum tenue]CAI0430513.1 unnamed protein product [Linum tenue]